MKRIKAIIFAIVISILASMHAYAVTPVQQLSPAVENNYFYSFGSTVTLQGVYGSQEFYFTVDKNWNAKKITLHLDISQSQRIDSNDISSITISLNGIPVKSFPLKDYMLDHSVVNYSFDISSVKVGSNDVKIQAYRRITDLPCADDVSAANWVNLNKNSGVNVSYTDKAPSMKISGFPYPFYKVQSDKTFDTAITVADNADDSVLASTLELDSAFGRYANSNDIVIDTARLSNLVDKNDKNIIYIGNSDTAPQSLVNYFPVGTDFSSGAAIKLVQSPYDSGKVMLIVLAKNDSDIERAIKFLENDSLVGQVQDSYFFVNRSIKVETIDSVNSSTYTFSDLGYDGSYVYGCFRKNVSIELKLPENKTIDEASSITLQFRYSKNLDFNKSLATIYVNDIPIGSKKLTSDNANNDSMTLKIPQEARKGNYFNVRIAFDLEMVNTWCTFRQEENPWAYVRGSSQIYLPTTQVTMNLFKTSPSPFIEDYKWNNTMFVLPANSTSSDLNQAGKIAIYLGHSIKSNHGTVSVTTNYKNNSNLSSSNLIAIGMPDQQQIIKDNNNSLFFKFDNSYKYFLSNDKLELLPEKSKNLASFQLLNSPYSSKTAMLVLTASDSSNLANAIDAFFQPSTFSITGDGVLIDQSENISDYRFKKDEISKPSFWSSNISSTNTVLFLITIISVVILLFVTLFLIIRKNRKFEVKHVKGKNENQP